MSIAKTVASASTHPKAPGGCVIVRDREIVGDGRSILTDSKVEIDALTYAIACASKNGTPLTGAVVYTTRYPYSASVFQCYLMGIQKSLSLHTSGNLITKMSSDEQHVWHVKFVWQLNLCTTNEDPRFGVNTQAQNIPSPELYSDDSTFRPDDYDPQSIDELDDDTTSFDLESTGLLRRGSTVHCIVMRNISQPDDHSCL